MVTIGLTGGTGVGKSTVAALWRDMGALVLNADEVYHEMLKTSPELLGEIEKAFDGVVEDGTLNRRALGEIVFHDSAKLETLNSITHPYVVGRIERLVKEERASGTKVVVIEALYLTETSFAQICDSVVGLVSTPEKRLKRVVDRDNIDSDYAWIRIMAQPGDEYYFQCCDHIIQNNETMETLKAQAKKLYLQIIGK